MVEDGVGAVDGAALAGDPDGDGVAVGDGADHVTSWHPDFMEVDASSGDGSAAHGDRVEFS